MEYFRFTKEVQAEAGKVKDILGTIGKIDNDGFALVTNGRAMSSQRILVATGVPVRALKWGRNSGRIKTLLESRGYVIEKREVRWEEFFVATPSEWLGRMGELRELEMADTRRRTLECGNLEEGLKAVTRARDQEKVKLMDLLIKKHSLSRTKVLAMLANGDHEVRKGLLGSLDVARAAVLAQTTTWREDVANQAGIDSAAVERKYNNRDADAWHVQAYGMLTKAEKKGLFAIASEKLCACVGATIEDALVELVQKKGELKHSAGVVDQAGAWAVLRKISNMQGQMPVSQGTQGWLGAGQKIDELWQETGSMAECVSRVLDSTWGEIVLDYAIVLAVESGHWGTGLTQDRSGIVEGKRQLEKLVANQKVARATTGGR